MGRVLDRSAQMEQVLGRNTKYGQVQTLFSKNVNRRYNYQRNSLPLPSIFQLKQNSDEKQHLSLITLALVASIMMGCKASSTKAQAANDIKEARAADTLVVNTDSCILQEGK